MENNCPSVSPLSDSKLQSERDSERLIEQLQHKKSRVKSEIVAEFLASQRALFESASREIESEIARHGERRLTPSQIPSLVEQITRHKMPLLKNELESNFVLFKSNLEIDVEISKEVENKDALRVALKPTQ